MTAKRPDLAFEGAGGDQAVAHAEGLDQAVEGETVAVEQHRLGDDLDGLVARAPQIGGQDARDLLDSGLGLAGELQQGALRNIAAKRHDQDREQRQVHLRDLRLIGVARQIALGVIDLRPDIGYGDVEVEAGIEFEEHITAAFESGRAHLLDVCHRFELGLERTQDQALGILRADAPLGDIDIDDGDRDVRLGFLRDRHIGEEPGHQQEQQGGKGQAGVADGVVDRVRHVFRTSASLRQRLRF